MKNKTQNIDKNLRFVFSYACVKVSVDSDIYTNDDKKKILAIIMAATKHIEIDKTYVDYKNTKYEKTFITNAGWNELIDLVIKTLYGRKCTEELNDILMESYTLMIQCYLYQFLEDLDYDVSAIHLELANKSMFMVLIFLDYTHSWNSYPGKWQSW